MKKLYTLLAIIATIATFAQAPQGFNYQATVRNSSGALIVNQIVLVKFNVYQNTATGTLVYSENQTVTTDDLGHINIVVGQGTATVGTFSTINWGTANYYLGIELNTGSGYMAMGTTQLLSVPYAFYANSSGNATPATPNLAAVLAVNNGANNLKISNLADPTAAQDAATKNYVDNAASANTTLPDGTIFVGNVTNLATSVALSGDVTITNIGAATIANNAITTAKIANANVTNAKLDKTNIPLSGFGAATADVNLGTKKLTNVADPTTAQDAATKNYVDNAASANTTLPDGTIFVGNVTNQATSVALSGDVTLTNTGAATIANNAVTTAKIANANVTNAKLDKANIPLSGFGAATADVNLGTKKITNLADPINAQDAVTKSYSEAQLQAQVAQLQAQIVALQILASPTITNGAQIWSNTNLDVATYRDGTPIPQVTLPSALTSLTTGAWCYYNNDPANGAIYGKLYNWYALAGIHDNDPNTPNKIFAPVGWHAPTNTEWTSFITFLGGEQVAGGKMKATGTTFWQRPNSDASNSSGFGGLPGGIVNDLRSSWELGQTGYWWSATESFFSNSVAFFCFMDFNSGVVRVEEQGYKQYFISVRLVRD